MKKRDAISELLLAGVSPQVIATRVDCSESTVWYHAGQLYKEAGVTNQVGYIAKHYAPNKFNSAKGE